MASRKKYKRSKQAVCAPAAMPAASRRRMLVLGISLIAAALFGIVGGFVYFATHRTTVHLGTINGVSTSQRLSDKELYAAYAGAASCRECHVKEFDAWSQSHHGLAERNVDAALDKAAFDPAREFAHGSQKTQVRAAGERYEVVTLGYAPEPSPYGVARVIGVDPLRQFLVRTTGGRLQTLEASYDPAKNQWFDVYGNEDRKPGEWGHWTGRGMNWNSECASCHNTRVRKNYDEKSDSYQTAMAQMTVSCESCHGPMKEHVMRKKSGNAGSGSGSASTRPYKFSANQILDTCGTCHARRDELTGDFAPGDLFHNHHSPAIPDLSEVFYADGQVKEEDYEFAPFLGSKMHAAGVRCVNCHDPHSSKTLFQGNLLCMNCHNGSFQGSPKIVPEEHSFHKADSAGNQCVNCHMPQTTYMQRHVRHDHGFTIPDPLLTREQNIPNACNRCHADKDADWSLAAVDKWYGAKMQRPTRERARAIARARKGDDGARGAILQMLRDEKQPYWQAVAAAVLGEWVQSPDVSAALMGALGHADPLVRENAARSLEPLAQHRNPAAYQALAQLANDPVRAVRIRAAWGVRDLIDMRSQAGEDLAVSLRLNADQPGGAMNQGLYHVERGQSDLAIAYFKKAIEWEPNSAPLRDNLGTVLIMNGHKREALEQFQQAARLEPRNADFAFRLAQAYDETGQLDRTIEQFERALMLNPRNARAAYNLGLAYNKAKQIDQAIAMLKRAEALDPNDAQIPYARATIHSRLGQKEEARQAAKRALEIDAGHEGAMQLIQQLNP